MAKPDKIRIGSAVAGAGLAAGAVAFAAFLAKRHTGGGDDAPPASRRRPPGEEALVGRTVTIRKPADELYRFWLDLPNLVPVMENVEAIRAEGEHHVWTIKAPLGGTVELRTRMVDTREGERIAWRSVEGSDIDTHGEVAFAAAPGERGTRVSLTIAYDPPAGAAGRVAAKLFLREPAIQARHDLKRFKMLMETGEIATSARRQDRTRAAKQEKRA